MRFVTMADEDFVPGLAALVQSMAEHAEVDDLRLTVVARRPLPVAVLDALRTTGVEIDQLLREELGYVPPQAHQRGRRSEALQKLLVFRLPTDERVTFLDSDMLCLGPIGGLDDLEPFSAVADGGRYGEGVLVEGRPMFNSGFFVFRPDPQLADELVSFFAESTERFGMGDQIALNTFLWRRYPETVHLVDPTWNTIKSRVGIDRRFTLDGVRFLHYAGRKPWEPIGPEPKHGHRYVPMYRLWWEHYQRSPVAPLLGLEPPPFRLMTALNAFPARRVWQAIEWKRGRLTG